jgi:diguanylate cyclase (GGDEF)-like protein
MRNRLLFFLVSAFAAALPALALSFPGLASAFAYDAASQSNWFMALDVALAGLAFLAWRLNQTPLTFVALGLGVSAHGLWAAYAAPALWAMPGLRFLEAWLFAVPAGLGLAMLPRQSALLSQRSFLRLLLLGLPALLLWSAMSVDPAKMAELLDWRVLGDIASLDPSHLAHLGPLAFGIVLWTRRDPKWADAQAALAGSLLGQVVLAWALAFAQPDAGLAGRAWLASHVAQAACLLAALFMMYWQRVYLDELTGIPNRRALDEALSHLDGPYCLAMADIDHFKKFNDHYGHDQGDDVLRLVGGHLAAATGGRAFRYGGEEFCVLLPGVEPEAAEALIEEARASLARRRFSIRLPAKIRKKTSEEDRGTLKAHTEDVQVTLSLGLARPDKKHVSAAQVMKLADQGLYAAKEAGRNNVQRMN